MSGHQEDPVGSAKHGLPALPAIESHRQKLSDSVYDVLCDYIVRGKLAPGQRLREAEVAVGLDVSRTPVREAFARLERQHLLDRDLTGAYLVASWDRQVLWEVATVRGTLEVLAISLVSEKLAQADFDYLQSLILQMEAAYRRGDYEALIDLDITFHSYIWSRTEHTILIEMLNSIKALVTFFIYLTRPGDEERYAQQHQQLLDVLREKDIKKAVEAIKQHTMASAEEAIARIEKR